MGTPSTLLPPALTNALDALPNRIFDLRLDERLRCLARELTVRA